MIQSEGVLLHFSFCKTESLRDPSQQPLAGLSAQLRRVRQYSAEYDIWDRRGKTQELLQGISPERVVARLCRPWLRVDQSADVLEVGANVGRPNQELVLEGKVFRKVLHRTDQVFRSLLDRFHLWHQIALVIESDSEVGIAVNHGEAVNGRLDLADSLVIQEYTANSYFVDLERELSRKGTEELDEFVDVSVLRDKH